MERFVVIKEKYAVQRSFSGAQESTSAQGPVSWMERVVGKVIGSPSPMSRRDSKRGSMVMSGKCDKCTGEHTYEYTRKQSSHSPSILLYHLPLLL
jgi:hypothetical protein